MVELIAGRPARQHFAAGPSPNYKPSCPNQNYNPTTPSLHRRRPTSAPFRRVRNASARFRTVRKLSEAFRTPPSVRRENCTLTVREVARQFEAAGVARSERSITNWCQPNRQGIARLEAYYDPNERRYFITPQSVEAVIAEEKANAEPLPHLAETFRTSAGNGSETFRTAPKSAEATQAKSSDPQLEGELAELKKENRDLQIANRGKDYFIERLEKEREQMLQQLVETSRTVGQLETQVRQLASPNAENSRPSSDPTGEATLV